MAITLNRARFLDIKELQTFARKKIDFFFEFFYRKIIRDNRIRQSLSEYCQRVIKNWRQIHRRHRHF